MSTVRSPYVQPMSLCNDSHSVGRGVRAQRDGGVSLRAARALAGARAAALELHEHERGGDRRPVGPFHPLVALLLEAAGAVHHVGEDLRQLIPRLLVEGQGDATDMDVLAVEAAFLRRAFEVTRDLTQRGVGERASQGGGELCPVVVADERRLERLVVVLDRAAPGLRAHQLDHVEVGKEAHVVADVAERLVELFGELARTGHLLVEQREHSHPEGVREGLHDPLIDGRLLCRHAKLAARCGGPNGVGRSRTLTINAAEAMQFLHPARGGWRVATNLNGPCQATRAPSVASSAPFAARSARSIPSSSTSRCVTARTRSGPTGSMPTPARSSTAQNSGASGTEKITMFVSTVAGSSPTPGSPARPSARRRARVWSSARRSTWWSSAYSPAAATIPDWRSAPPSICFHRHASAISSAEPTRHAPTGAPRPLVKSSHALSKPPAHAAASMPLATTAFMRRAPSRCARSPCVPATPRTASTCSSGHTRPPPMFVGCSTQTSRGRGAYRSPAGWARIAASSASAVNMLASPSTIVITAPETAAGAPPSKRSGCVSRPSRISSPPGRMCRRIAISLHIVPEGRKTAASWPSSAATRSSSAMTVGSSRRCSSPTSARAIASRISGVGRVWVSEKRLTMCGLSSTKSRHGRHTDIRGPPHPPG